MASINIGILSPEEVLERSGVEGLKKSMEALSTDKTCIIFIVDGKLEWGFGEREEEPHKHISSGRLNYMGTHTTCEKCGCDMPDDV